MSRLQKISLIPNPISRVVTTHQEKLTLSFEQPHESLGERKRKRIGPNPILSNHENVLTPHPIRQKPTFFVSITKNFLGDRKDMDERNSQ